MPSPSRIQVPSPNIYYRIQSVSLVSYLDLHNVDDSKVFLRPLHDDNEQKWIFVPSADGFKIMSAATEHLRNKRYLSLDLQAHKDAYAATDRDSSRPTIWNVTQEQGGEGIFSFTCDAGSSNAETFLSIDPYSRQTSFEVKQLSNTSILPRDMKWRILEVTPSIPKDVYRIWTWLGRVLHMTSDSNVVSLVPLEKKRHEEWEVEPLGNGRCTIKSVVAGSYLGWETGSDSITRVVKTNLPKEWIVKSISGYIYSITTSDKPLYAIKDLALSNGDTSELYMKPINVTQNQIWFFEAVNVSTDASADEPDTSPGKIVRYADITEKTWIIYNAMNAESTQKPRYIVFFGFACNYRPLGLYSGTTSQNQFNLKYTATDSGEFYLTNSMNAPANVIRVSDEVKLDAQNPSGWVLQRVVGASDTSRFYYFICAADDHNSVLSGEPQKCVHGDVTYDLLTMTTKNTQNTPLTQMWAFGS